MSMRTKMIADKDPQGPIHHVLATWQTAGVPRITQWLSCYYDAVLVVDESDAGMRQEDGSRTISGRLLGRLDHRRIAKLEEALACAKAERWHASGSSPDLFVSNQFEAVLCAVKALQDPWVVEMRAAHSEIEAIRDQYADLLEKQPNLRPTWSSSGKATSEELMFFRFVAMAPFVVFKHAFSHDLDRQPFISERGAKDFVDVPTWGQPELRAHGLDVDTKCIVDKKHRDVQDVLRVVGLVDSELWAMNRILSRRFAGGETLDAKYRDWSRRGRPESEHILTQELLDEALSARPTLNRYMEEVILPMYQEGRVLLVTDDAMDEDVALEM